jgi:hypothetical protein
MGEAMVSFHLSPAGGVDAVTLAGLPEARFARLPDAAF